MAASFSATSTTRARATFKSTIAVTMCEASFSVVSGRVTVSPGGAGCNMAICAGMKEGGNEALPKNGILPLQGGGWEGAGFHVRNCALPYASCPQPRPGPPLEGEE